MERKVFIFFILFTQLLGIAIFCIGFFPPRVPLEGIAQDDASDVKIKRTFGKTVIMVVDALRSEFLYGDDSMMNWTRGMISEQKAFPYIGRAQAPTVTLPRIKVGLDHSMR